MSKSELRRMEIVAPEAIKQLREQIAREIAEMEINLPDPTSLEGYKSLTPVEVKIKALAIARGEK